ncbi:PhzF family phenazine biosynthesis protein [Pendulispora rubella]|uniref:PhzF family phenazine biosynthesis protein n=1 Tax=Pendulispora rubella TaxID=2741070 RepID=A0ABZ2LHF4_9BACT
MSLPFKQVDVFTDRPFAGNPLAVIFGADDLTDSQMQRIANWTNLSETTFLLQPQNTAADYRLRIFSPRAELVFAGHPTVGSAHAALEAGVVTPKNGKLVQECAVGLVALTVQGDGAQRSIAFELPPARTRLLEEAEVAELEDILGAKVERAQAPRVVDVGPKWTIARLQDATLVRELNPDLGRMEAFDRRRGTTGVTLFGAHAPSGRDDGPHLEVRSFAPAFGAPEDPVCGSGNGSVAVFLRDTGLVETIGRRYVASQGARLGRDGRVRVSIDEDGTVRLGGQCVTCVEGTLRT